MNPINRYLFWVFVVATATAAAWLAFWQPAVGEPGLPDLTAPSISVPGIAELFDKEKHDATMDVAIAQF